MHCDIVLPVFHVLMTGRKEGIYIGIFRKIKELSSDFQPRISMADYEAAIGSALKVVFPEIRLTSCRFHYGQAILRKIKAVGLQSEYINNSAIKRRGRKFVAMCLLPCVLIRAEVDLLKTEMSRFAKIETREKMRKFVFYFEKYWMTTQTPAFFSVHGLQFRTNNVSESLHSKMNRCMAAHPSFWRFLDDIYHQIIVNAELDLNQLQNGHQPRRGQRRERVRSFERLQSYEEKLSTGEWTPTKFLEASAFYFNDIKLTSEGDTEQEQDENPQENVQDHQQETRPMETLCKICLALPLEVVVLPCRHFCMCLQCSDNLANGGNKRCPICLSKIENFLNVFVS
ncbi:uncharacterized protein LOC136092698 [Hydra vulgaris]|uniref:uncharacterized protein LOC136092698 n=1 Tax=Hydra vulgaris TaxID=6087 RepID=UPI0032EA2CB0